MIGDRSEPGPIASPQRPSGKWRAEAARSTDASLARRRRRDRLMTAVLAAGAVLTMLPLVLVLGYLSWKGLPGLRPTLFLELPVPVGEPGGGLANAFAGSALLVVMALGLGLPVGLLAGLHLAERPGTRLSVTVRYVADVLNGTPSIVIGIAAWAAVVRPMQRFSALAGAAALATILLPLIARTTEEMVRIMPPSLREAALALGYTEWRTALRVIGPAALPGITTGVVVAIARIAGETAPLLFTAFGNPFWSLAPTEPIAAVPLQVYTYALSPYETWQRQAWAAALVLVLTVGGLTFVGRSIAAKRGRRA
ncbi:MAG: phosphate ABC transporter permease PstA [Gemmatimonadota bacterium]